MTLKRSIIIWTETGNKKTTHNKKHKKDKTVEDFIYQQQKSRFSSTVN